MTRPHNGDDRDPLLTGGGSLNPEAVGDAMQTTGNDDGPVTVTFTLKRNLSKRLDKYLADRIPYMSRSALQRLIASGAVTVNGRASKPSTSLHQGDEVRVIVPPPPSKDIPAQDIPLDILFEDEHMIVVNKQAGLIVHPARSEKSGTLINGLAYHLQHRSAGRLSSVGEAYARPGVVHRLDRNTTGVIVSAKTDEAHWRLGTQFQDRTTDKRYLAVVHGRLDPPADIIDLPLGHHPRRDKGYREKYVVRHDDASKPSVTIYRVREYYQGYTLVELEPKSGRTHQLRVHLSYLGYPIVGDDMYGGKPVCLDDLAGGGLDVPDGLEAGGSVVMGRQALHAALLTVAHPMTGERMTFQAPLPADMARLIRVLRACRKRGGPVAIQGTTVDLGAVLGDEPAL
ncbi:MAG: RluA family pseudouridine synthase [Phycisphaerales bacterium]|nr:RluA family pseudouridine synthase [Phycisphaerales bacterium]